MEMATAAPTAFRKEQELFCLDCGTDIDATLRATNEAEGIPAEVGALTPVYEDEGSLYGETCDSCGYPVTNREMMLRLLYP